MVMKDLVTTFADAINRKQMVMVRFKTQSGQVLLRRCAPLDYALAKRANIKRFKFHFWDFDKNHLLSLDAEQIIELVVTDEDFRPKEFITWDTKASQWLIKRDWEIYS